MDWRTSVFFIVVAAVATTIVVMTLRNISRRLDVIHKSQQAQELAHRQATERANASARIEQLEALHAQLTAEEPEQRKPRLVLITPPQPPTPALNLDIRHGQPSRRATTKLPQGGNVTPPGTHDITAHHADVFTSPPSTRQRLLLP